MQAGHSFRVVPPLPAGLYVIVGVRFAATVPTRTVFLETH